MTEATPSPTNGRFHFKWLIPLLIHPRHAFEHVLLRKATWLTPLLVISLLVVAQVLVMETRTFSGADMVPAENIPAEGVPPMGKGGGGGGSLEEGPSPDGMGTETRASSGWKNALLATVSKLAGLWIGWFILTLLLFVALVISGSQGNFSQALNLTAWSSLPYAIQILAQILFLFAYSPGANLPQGLAGLASQVQGQGGQFLGIVFQRVDIFLLWQVILLMVGAVFISQLPAGKTRWLVLLAILVYLVLAALPAFGMEQFSLLQSAAQPKYY